MEWKEVYIKDICTVLGDGLHGTPEYDEKGDFYFINGNNLQEGHITIKKDTKRVSQKEFLKYQKELNDRTILVSINGTIGNVAKYNNEPCILGKSACFFNVKEDIDRNFIYYVISSPHFKKSIIQQATGTTIKNVSLKQMRDYHFLIPVNLSDQRKIAGILSALDAKIENNNKINANLEAQAQALFKSWFVDFTPFKDQPFVDSELGPIPQGWKVGKINEFVDVIYGAPYKSKLFNTQKEGLPLIRIRDLKTCSPQFYTKELLPNTELVNYGDVVAGLDAEFTPHIWLGETGLLNQRVCKFKPHTGISPLYSMLMIKPKLEFAQNYKVGTTVSHLGKSDIDKFIVIVPPLDIVKEVSSIFDAVLNEQINLAKENQRLAALRDTLLPKLMSGEIKL
ncbi:MAG: restriction endonuclease subunit S [Sodaliphilus sp.]|nr:restriction endonuclease subunit S [Sodaliphilus sp.]